VITSNLQRLGLRLWGGPHQQGYFAQYLNADGWQQERYLINDLQPALTQNAIPMARVTDCRNHPRRTVYARVWRVQVGTAHAGHQY